MKITGAKKLSIILLSLGCSVAAGLGVLFSGAFSTAPVSYAQTAPHAIIGEEEDVLAEFSQMSGISERDIKFYANSNGLSVEAFYQYYLHDKTTAENEIMQFLNGYAQGNYTRQDDISNEDWYLAPDEVGNYNQIWSSGTMVGIPTVWTEYYTSKSFITTEEFYWRESGFQWGHMLRAPLDGWASKPSNYEKDFDVLPGVCIDSRWLWDIVWLDEGEQFEFGVKSVLNCGSKGAGAMPVEYFLDTYLSEKPAAVYDYGTNHNNVGVWGLAGHTFGGNWQAFTDGDAATLPDDNDLAPFEPTSFTTCGTRGDYKDEFGSTIKPNDKGGNYNFGNSSFYSWAPDSLQSGNAKAGVHKLRVSKDAPSGVYFMAFDNPVYPGVSKATWYGGLHTQWVGNGKLATDYNSVNWYGWQGWSIRQHYAVMVCRKGVSKPQAAYGAGVSSDLTSKTVDYTGEPQEFVLKGDWGPGLSTVKLEEWNKNTSTWVDVTAGGGNVTIGSRPAAGAGIKGETAFTATNAGKYRITYTPFRNWTDGSQTPAEYNFEIKPMKLDMTKIVQEEGVNQSTNTKYLHATQQDLYISLYPVSQEWAEFSTPLDVFNYSDSGVLTLVERNQGVYPITVTLKDTNNVSWDDGTDNGSTDPLNFTFEIGPEKVKIPDIIAGGGGSLGDDKKEVIFNGNYQTMQFMPISPHQLDISVQELNTGQWMQEGVNYKIEDNVLTVSALDAGKYEIKLKVKPQYIFDDLLAEQTFYLIIHEQEIDAPILDEPTAVNNVKTVTYGGEKVLGDNGVIQDWAATLAFKNADEARIRWVPTSALSLGQDTWGDSQLVLKARNASTYTIKFEPQKNYKWKPGVNPPEYTLVIEKLKIAFPTLFNDNEEGAKYTTTSKEIGFDGNAHPFMLQFPTLPSSAGIDYTKKSSVFIIHNGSFDEEWNTDGDRVTFTGTSAGTFLFNVAPTDNYCWQDGTVTERLFTFKIIPVSVDALHMFATPQFGGEPTQVFFSEDEGFRRTVTYDGGEKTVIIGNKNPVDDSQKYVTSGSYEKYFFLLDEDGNMINNPGADNPKLLPNMTANEDNGFLTITAIDAGTYRIAVYIRNTNYWWKETSATVIVYTLIIEAEGIPQPQVDENASVGYGILQFEKDTENGVYTMPGVFYDVNFKFVSVLDAKYMQYIEITDPDGNVYEHNSSFGDGDIQSEANNALKEKGGFYTAWFENNLLFFAKDHGTYSWKIKVTDPNHKWAGTETLELTFTISIVRAPVSGLEFHFIGDEKDAANLVGGDELVVRDNVRGSDADAQTITYDQTTFSDDYKEIYFKRTNTTDLVNTGFNAQYEYSIKKIASADGYDTDLMKDPDAHSGFLFNEEELRLFAFDAGTYEITLVPSDNYCWNDADRTTGAVIFKLVIKKRVLDKPVIINDDGTFADGTVGAKRVEFNHKYQTFSLHLENFAQGYKVDEFKYFDKEGRVGVDFEEVKTEGTATVPDGETLNLGTIIYQAGETFNLGGDADVKAMCVQAKSAGEYSLIVIVSNVNNYVLKDGTDKFTFRYDIDKLKVELPSAYLSTESLDAEQAAKKVHSESDVKNSVGQKEVFAANKQFTVSTEYDGKYHTVYFYGADVSKGDFRFTVECKTNNGDTLIKTIQPEDILVNNTSDPTQKAGYFMLAATSVNTYTIKLEFTSKDFYWDGTTQDEGSKAYEFKFIITKNVIEVPKFDGMTAGIPLENDSYTMEHFYEFDTNDPASTRNKAVAFTESISDVMLGLDLGTANNPNPINGEYKYSNITVKVSSLATPDSVLILDPVIDPTDGLYTISFSTASLNPASGKVETDGGLVPNVYCLELEINPENSEWKTGDKEANKKYFIKVNKMKIGVQGTDGKYSNPELEVHDLNEPTERHVTYDGRKYEYVNNDVNTCGLWLNNYDVKLMKWEASANLIPQNQTDPTVDVSGTAAGDPYNAYGERIIVNTPADADTYTLTVKVADPDNMEWGETGSSDDIEYKFVIDPVKVAKPYIENSANDTAVIGNTKTVTFYLDSNNAHAQQGLKIGNYWYNSKDTLLTLANTPAAGLPVDAPFVMNVSVANGTLVTNYPKYYFDQFTIGGSQQGTSMLYNGFNNGLVEIMATEAGTYVIRFKLTDNAVWLDGTNSDIDITLIIKKREVRDLEIVPPVSGEDAKVEGNTKTVRFKLDANEPNGNGKFRHILQLDHFDSTLMGYDGLIGGTATSNNGIDGFLVDVGANSNLYDFNVWNAGEYEVSFKLTDGNNYRWTYADTDMAYFKIKVEKLILDNPEIANGEYKLPNEVIDDGLRTLTVDYDLREHTVLVKSLLEKLGVPFTDYAKYFRVSDTTSTDYPDYAAATHISSKKEYANTNGLKVKDLFEILGASGILATNFNYDGEHKNESVSLENLFTLTAYKPGEYYLTFKLADPDNMSWANGGTPSVDDVKFKVIINKVKHDAPRLISDDVSQKEYTGKPVTFTLENVFNGIVNEGEQPTATVSEKFTLTNYVGKDTAIVTGNDNDAAYVSSWFNGNLVLKFTSIGVYTVRVSITDTNNISWNNTSDTYKDFTFTITARTLSVKVKFTSPNQPELDPGLADKPVWAVSTQVTAEITIMGLVPKAGVTPPVSGNQYSPADIDRILGFKVFYSNTAVTGSEYEPMSYDENSNPPDVIVVALTDGTFNLIIRYKKIQYGKGNIQKGRYMLHINADSHDGNYSLNDTRVLFEVQADPAPFDTEMLEWAYTRSDKPATQYYPVPKSMGGDANNRFTGLTFEDGITYTFHLRLNATGMQGYQNTGAAFTNVIDALNSWKVTWSGTYSGTQAVTNAGDNFVSAKIIALDPDEYAFDDFTFTLYYKVQKAKYDLSNLIWDYDGNTKFIFDGTNKTVAIDGLSASQYAGLTVDRYITDGWFISYDGVNNLRNAIPAANGNTMMYAGTYSTTVVFKVAANSNYYLPDISDAGSYTGTFSWTREWEIDRQEIEVEWVTNTTTSSNGDVVTKKSPVIAAPHTSKFKPVYEKWNATTGTWDPVTDIKRDPYNVLKYRATAKLVSDPSNAANDAARNYIFELLGDNPLEFEVGADDLEIINHIEVNGERLTQYEYTGNPFVATNVIDFDITNGLIDDSSKMQVAVIYYEASAPTVPLSGAPKELGSYIVKLKLSYTDLDDDYKFSEPEYSFEIVKAKFKGKDFNWQITHDDGKTQWEAKFENGKWINVATKEEVAIQYDGHAYEIKLVSPYADTVISFLYTDNNEIDAGAYAAAATATYDTVHYEFDTVDPVALTYNWVIEKHNLDLSKLAWDYEQPYEFTIVNGVPKAFKAELKNVPDYLLDKLTYSVMCGNDPVTGSITNFGTYVTTANIDTTKIDSNNYELSAWPVSVPQSLTWIIKRKEFTVPQDDLSWTEFDGIQHNLLKPFGLDVDYEEYFDIDVTYTNVNGDSVNYDGTAKYGNKYYAFDAGTYRFTFKLNKDFNTSELKNVVWVVVDGGTTTRTDNDQNVSYTVKRRSLKVIGWNNNFEMSTAILENGIDPSKFLEYKFYEGSLGDAGNEVGLDVILASAGGDTFSMVPVVKEKYQGNITLSFDSGMQFTTFTTEPIDQSTAVKVNDKPYIYGYMAGGELHRFTNDELSSGTPSVIYTGQTIEFKIFNWDSYYSNYVTVWNGSLDDLVQTEAGKYSITLILRKDLGYPLYWGEDANGNIDRSSVTLNFEIRYRMLTIPDVPEELIYDGSQVNILSKATNATLDQLLAEYGDYVAIRGDKATNVGSQVLYLQIKDTYGNAVRWNDGTDQGIAGTYSITWTIKPVLLVRPEKDDTKTIEYDGKEHSVYEFLVGYDASNVPQSIKDLMKHVIETNGRSINAGTFNAVLSLPNDNYSWCDAAGNVLADRSSVEITWTIDKKVIDFANAYWGYMDGETPVAYDAANPFVYAVSNGSPQAYTVELMGMPEILKLYAKYTTNGAAGNSASTVDTYQTAVTIDLTQLDGGNYTIKDGLTTYEADLTWKIIPREFDLPASDESWTVYDGEVHDLTQILGLGEDWANYFDVTVEYKENEGGSWEAYKGENDMAVGFSNYKAYKYGYYKIKVDLKYSSPVWIPGTNVLWKGGAAPEAVVLHVSMRDVTVMGWYEDNENSHVLFENGEVLPEGIAEKFEYLIYAEADVDKTPVAPEDIVGGERYYIEFKFKDGFNALGISYKYGVNLKLADGVENPFLFGNYDYGTQSIIWMPTPVLETAVAEYTGSEIEFIIKDFENLYKMTDTERNVLNANYNLGLDETVKSFVYLQNASSLKAIAAGEYSAVVRFLNKVKLSWYDPEKYEASADHKTLYRKGTQIAVTNPDELYENKSFVLNFRITPKKVPLLSNEDLEKLVGILVAYDGTEKDVTVEAKAIFDELELKYGKIFDYAGSKGTAADIYELIITLADNDSCVFYKPDSMEVVDKNVVDIEGYKLQWVQEGGSWKLILAKVDSDGNPVKDSSGKYSEYFDTDGDYKIDAKFMPDFETEYVSIDCGDGTQLLKADGTLNEGNTKNYFEFNNTSYLYDYKTDENGNIVKFKDIGSGVYVPDANGTHILRYNTSETDGMSEYGYKIAKTEDAKEYSYLFSALTVDADGHPIPVMIDGKTVDTYLTAKTGGGYELVKYQLTSDGRIDIDAMSQPIQHSQIEANCQLVNTDRYKLVNGQYVSDANGEYMYRYVLDGGSRKQVIKYLTDSNGNYIIDNEHSVIKVDKYEIADGLSFKVERNQDGTINVVETKIDSGVQYKVDWSIDSSVLAVPVLDETKVKQYTGKKIYAKDVLKGFIPDLMEIVEGGEGVDAGEYTAKIVITTPNSKWDPEVTTENFVYVTWRIDKAKVDLSNLEWRYYAGTEQKDDGSDFVYTRKDGKPVVFWVGLGNVPEALQDRIIYNTNGKQGAHAGTNVGKYRTYFSFNVDNNFETVELPENFATTIDWNIKRRMLQIPELGSVQLVFDGTAHNLLEYLGVPEDWNEYYDIDVKYSNGGEYVPFLGTDGEPFLATDAGNYMFTFSIKSGINTSATNPNAVWVKKADLTPPTTDGDTQTPDPDPDQTPEPTSHKAVKKSVQQTEEAAEEIIGQIVDTVKKEVKTTEKSIIRTQPTQIEQVCDRLNKLVCSAEVQFKSYRKFSMRGTL